jgi:signal transduction histidine kinase
MRLAKFILNNVDTIVSHWESFAAGQLPAAASMDSLALRDHAEPILRAIASDMETYQSREAQLSKSLGQNSVLAGAPDTAAQTHAILRARSGFDINQLAAEYRALRASVLRAWTDASPNESDQLEQVMRFNEAIDQALAESVGYFHAQVERSRNLFLGMLGHDLRSPLQSIQMTATHLSALNAGAEVSEAAARLINSGSRMKALLDDLVDFNRTRLGLGIRVNPSPIDAAATLTDELNLLRAAHPARQIDLEVTGDNRGVWDGMRLRQVLNNLVVNAIKYGDDAPVQVALKGDENELALEVRNFGTRIEPAVLQNVFDPLRRGVTRETAEDSSSLGLGLYIAQRIVKAHGGDIQAHSTPTQTVFAVRLPKRAR